MNVIPQTSEVVSPAWVKAHQVSFEFAPVREYVKGHGLQPTGHSLTLFGRFDPCAGDDPVEVARSIYARLHALALEALRDLPVPVLIQVEPLGRGVVPLDASLLIDVQLTVVVGSRDGTERPLPPPELPRVIQLVDARLRTLGLGKR